MRLNLVIVALALALTALLAGCGQDTSPGQTTVVFHHATDLVPAEALSKLLRQFEQANPDIKVRSKPFSGSNADLKRTWAAALQKKSPGFDLYTLDLTWAAEFAQAGWLKDLSSEFASAARDEFFHDALQAGLYQGRLVALPWLVDAGVLYYRKDLLQEKRLTPPEVWGDLIRLAQTLTTGKQGLDGFLWQGKAGEALVCNVLEYCWSNGGDVLKDNQALIDTPANQQALAFVRNLITKYHVSQEVVRFSDEQQSLDLFTQGRAVFLRHWTSAWKTLQKDGAPMQDKVGLVILPHFPNQEPASALAGCQLGINPNCQSPEAALRLLKFLVSASSQKALARESGVHPALRKLYEDPDLIQVQPLTSNLYNVFLHARTRPVSPLYPKISQAMQSEFTAALDRSKTPETALSNLQARVAALLPAPGPPP